MLEHPLLVTIVATIVLGVSAQVLAERTGLPSIIYLLSMGVVFGPDLLDVVRPELLGRGLFAITALSVAIILFEGGLTLDVRNVRHVSRSVLNLITIGALVTWAGATLSARLILDVSWIVAILFGSLVIVTGPTVIGPLLRIVRVKREVRTILKWEGILIDPVGAIIAVLVLGFVVVEGTTLGGTIASFLGRIIFGAGIGLAGGFLMTRLMKLRLSESISTLLIFAVVFLMFGTAELLIQESGIMSVTIAGIVMGNMHVPNLAHVKGFKEKVTLLMVSVLFVLLAANLRVAEIQALGWEGVFVVLSLMCIVRPLNIWASVRERALSIKDKLFLSWVAPRGIVAAAVASLFTLTLEQHGFAGARLLSSLTFLTIGITVLVQGVTAKPVARILRVLQSGTGGVLILGGNNIVFGIARELRNHGIAVAIVDSNKRNTLQAEREGITAYLGDILDEQTWDEMDLSSFGYFLAATSNNELNSLACRRAGQVFKRDYIYQLRNSYKNEKQAFPLSMVEGNQQYDLSVDVVGISNDLRAGKRMIESVPPSTMQSSSGEDVFLCGIGVEEMIFSTDPETLRSASRVVRLVES